MRPDDLTSGPATSGPVPSNGAATGGEPPGGGVLLREVLALLDRRYPPGTAESWDAVGLVTGEPDQPVRRVMFAVDPTLDVVDEALAWSADLLVTHHPLLLRPVHSVAATTAKGAAIHRLLRSGCALHVAHTNADSAPGGVAEALAEVLGLVDLRPLVPAPGPELDKHVVMIPAQDADRLVDAMADAGAGRLGEYSRCAWTTTGVGTFIPSEAANPTIGRSGRPERVDEARVEMIAPRRLRSAVLAAVRAAHPYEEPAFDVLEPAAVASGTGLGRVGRLQTPTTLAQFAAHVAGALPSTEQGVRVAGDPEGPVRTVAVLGGSGDSLFDAVRASGADAYVTADLRHHPASEARETAALASGRPYLIDVAHFASEWPWLPVAERALRADLEGHPHGATVETRVSTLRTDPWTMRLASSEGTP